MRVAQVWTERGLLKKKLLDLRRCDITDNYGLG